MGARKTRKRLERSLRDALRGFVFEPNDEPLWSKAHCALSEVLRAAWQSGALQGDAEDDAFFVKVGRDTMTEADLDTGRLICEIGIAPVRPAEFVIFRIGQKTASSGT